MKYLILIYVLLSGCSTLPNQSDNDYQPFSKTYFLDISSDCIRYPEYPGLRQEISETEYRILPLHIQTCYEKETSNGQH